MLSFFRDNGFTLIEIVLVLALGSLVATLVFSSLSGVKAAYRDHRRESDMVRLQAAVESFYSNTGRYPGTLGVFYTNYGTGWTLRCSSGCGTGDPTYGPWLDQYKNDLAGYINLDEVKALPMSQAAYIGTDGQCHKGSASTLIQYVAYADGKNYKISTRMETACGRVELDMLDQGTSTCCPIISGSKGRSYEVFELFSKGAANLNPTY